MFTDIEGSTRRWEADADAMRAALVAHDEVLRTEIAALEARLGSRLDASGDAAIATSARLAAIDQAIKAHTGSLQSLESAIAQTDDLVERVVEALDSLERSVAEQNEIKAAIGRD